MVKLPGGGHSPSYILRSSMAISLLGKFPRTASNTTCEWNT